MNWQTVCAVKILSLFLHFIMVCWNVRKIMVAVGREGKTQPIYLLPTLRVEGLLIFYVHSLPLSLYRYNTLKARVQEKNNLSKHALAKFWLHVT